ncbi:MAG: EAL domain-containing protein [Leptolyngbyaceae cyanobacterium SM2_3_12]|nr:EAL domain-containing protein [Leptolyngbyaceae cyanobacterium SM2_3_12]
MTPSTDYQGTMVKNSRKLAPNHSLAAVLRQWTVTTQNLAPLSKEAIQAPREEVHLNQVFAAAPLGMVLFNPQTCQLTKVNAALCHMLGYSAQELMTMTWLDLMAQADRSRTEPCINRFITREGQPRPLEPLEHCFVSKLGQAVWVNVHLAKLTEESPQPPVALAMLENITARKQAELALEVGESRYRALVSNLPGAVYRMVCRGEGPRSYPPIAGWTVEFISEGITEILGFEIEEFTQVSGRFSHLIDPDEAPSILREIATALTQQSPFRLEYRCLAKDGQPRWLLDRGQGVWDIENNLKYVEGVLLDITHLKTTEAQLAHRTSHDSLTGLPNRALFFKHLDRALLGRSNGINQLAVLVLDVDNFKVINDSMGHSVGDQLLVEIAIRLRTCLRPDDFIARLGGDEFVVHIHNIAGLTDVTLVADRIEQVMKQPFELPDLPITVSVSMGITLQSENSIVIYHQAHDMLRDAEIAMYRAKQEGRAQFALYDTSMHEQAMERLELETALRLACSQKEFVVYYQPIMNLGSETLAGFEALVRWQHPVQGLIMPDKFIPIAEETGLILAIDDLVLATACEQMVHWQRQWPLMAPLSLSVNLSTRHFTRPDLVDWVAQVLTTTGLVPHRLKLEITESVLINNGEQARHTLEGLNALGVSISLDDFGTGYSSLSYIHQFPMHTLKIDRSFVAELNQRPESGEIVGAILAMAKSLRLEVVAEGIETDQHLVYLKGLDCKFGQGYWFSRPWPLMRRPNLFNLSFNRN